MRKIMRIKKTGESLALTSKPESWDGFFNNVPQVTQDFAMPRDKTIPQKRKEFAKRSMYYTLRDHYLRV